MYAATGVRYENKILASDVSTSVMLEAIGVSCIDAPIGGMIVEEVRLKGK